MSFSSLWLVGAGTMGKAMLGGWLRQGISASSITVIDPEISFTLPPGIRTQPVGYPKCVVLAVKPQSLEEIIPSYVEQVRRGKAIIVSIAAGKSLEYFENHFGSKTTIVRAMPNLPATIGQGITVACTNRTIPTRAKKEVTDLLKALGQVCWLENESAMDAITALSGSGPAYLFYYLECMTEIGVELGLEPALAKTLALATVEGSAALAGRTEVDWAQLRQAVASKGGTTEAGLKVLTDEKAGLKPVLFQTVRAAYERSKSLR